MPKANSRVTANGELNKAVIVQKNGIPFPAIILQQRADSFYVHYAGTDKRMDEWVHKNAVVGETANGSAETMTRGRKRKRAARSDSNSCEESAEANGRDANGVGLERPLTEEEIDIREHRKITATRNFDKVIFGSWMIKTWYFSPYPLFESEAEDLAATAGSNKLPPTRIHNVNRASLRAHGRTSDLLAGGLSREGASGEKATLWVCDRCFKYMRDGSAMELHSKSCHARHPPGRKVYQRGAHIIWEVDGAKEKLFCQNLSLFGKLFIDIKTLFFDCDNFMFYLLTDADSQRDHVLGFFSKEKVSYDDYNLACIVTFPPYQRKRYGMLLIEFSYELSRRAGKLGTPERPLSDLGLRSYLTYWIAALVRFFRRLLSVAPTEVLKGPHGEDAIDPDLLGFIDSDAHGEGQGGRRRRRGWNDDMEVTLQNQDAVATTNGANDVLYKNQRHIRAKANADGSVTTHVYAKCTLQDISLATGLRTEDIAFTLHECGLLQRRRRLGSEEEDANPTIVVSREMVENVARERGVKKMCMEVKHVLL